MIRDGQTGRPNASRLAAQILRSIRDIRLATHYSIRYSSWYSLLTGLDGQNLPEFMM